MQDRYRALNIFLHDLLLQTLPCKHLQFLAFAVS